jgi:hypothetical protein
MIQFGFPDDVSLQVASKIAPINFYEDSEPGQIEEVGVDPPHFILAGGKIARSKIPRAPDDR